MDDARRESEAVERLDAALEDIRAGLPFYWHWGDGCGGYLLERLAAIVREEGFVWPTDAWMPASQKPRKQPISRRLAKQVMERDAYRCVACGTHIDLSCDHIIPESKGGPTTFENLQTMCIPCNSKKGVR